VDEDMRDAAEQIGEGEVTSLILGRSGYQPGRPGMDSWLLFRIRNVYSWSCNMRAPKAAECYRRLPKAGAP